MMWLEEKQFPSQIWYQWKDFQEKGWAGFRLAIKLKKLKKKVKDWAKNNFGDVHVIKDSILEEIQSIWQGGI